MSKSIGLGALALCVVASAAYGQNEIDPSAIRPPQPVLINDTISPATVLVVDGSTASSESPRMVTSVVRLRHSPAVEIANVIHTLYPLQPVVAYNAYAAPPLPVATSSSAAPLRAVAESVTNSIVLHGPGEDVERAAELIRELDAPRKSVSLELFVVGVDATADVADMAGPREQFVARLKQLEAAQHGAVYWQGYVRSMDNQAASMSARVEQPSQQAVCVPGQACGDSPQSPAAVAFTPRVDGDGSVVAEIDVAVPIEGFETMTLQTTTTLPIGQCVVLRSVSGGRGDQRATFAVVAVATIEDGEPRPATAAKTPARTAY